MITALRPHLLTFFGLIGLLALTAFASRFPIGLFAFPLAFGCALAQAILIAIFFMDLRKSSKLLSIVAAVGLIWLAILFLLALTDYLSRYPSA